MKITHINPDGLHNNPAFSQAVVAEGGKTIYIGGQNGILPDGSMAGDSLAMQTEQAYKNILEILRLLEPHKKTSSSKPFSLSKDRIFEKVLLPHKKSGEISPPQLALPSLKLLAFQEH